VPRRNPELAVVVLQEHGDWGANSAHIAQAIVTTYVNKQRRRENNVLQKAGENKPVEVGAVWSAPAPADGGRVPQVSILRPGRDLSVHTAEADSLHSGHFPVDPPAKDEIRPSGAKARSDVAALNGTTKVVPFQNVDPQRRRREGLH